MAKRSLTKPRSDAAKALAVATRVEYPLEQSALRYLADCESHRPMDASFVAQARVTHSIMRARGGIISLTSEADANYLVVTILGTMANNDVPDYIRAEFVRLLLLIESQNQA